MPVEFLAVSASFDEAEARAFVDEFGLQGLDTIVDLDGSVFTSFGIVGQPAWVFLDDDGGMEIYRERLGGSGVLHFAQQLAER